VTHHYRLSPSGSSRWLRCLGSLTLPGEDRTSVYAEEGTDAHLAANLWLLDGIVPADSELAEAVGHFFRFCRDILWQVPEEWGSEETFESTAVKDFGGTVDFWAVVGDVGYIVDYKHGTGVRVTAEGNTQLLCYAALLAERFPDVAEWRLTIVQPRGHWQAIDTVEVSGKEVAEFMGRVKEAAAQLERVEAGEEPAPFDAGDHCRWCPAKAKCEHLYQLTVQTANEVFDAVPDAEQDKWVHRWLHLREIGKAIESLVAEAEKQLLSHLKSGGKVSGLKLVRCFGNREWAGDEAFVLKRLKKLGLGVKQATDRKLKSPAQIEKLKVALPDDLTAKPERGLAVAPESDRRPAYDPLAAFDSLS
jgi:hypothetical protein